MLIIDAGRGSEPDEQRPPRQRNLTATADSFHVYLHPGQCHSLQYTTNVPRVTLEKLAFKNSLFEVRNNACFLFVVKYAKICGVMASPTNTTAKKKVKDTHKCYGLAIKDENVTNIIQNFFFLPELTCLSACWGAASFLRLFSDSPGDILWVRKGEKGEVTPSDKEMWKLRFHSPVKVIEFCRKADCDILYGEESNLNDVVKYRAVSSEGPSSY